MANALNIEVYELFIDPLSPPEEMERLYQSVAKNIDQLICESMERHCRMTAKIIERIVDESIEKALSNKRKDIKKTDKPIFL